MYQLCYGLCNKGYALITPCRATPGDLVIRVPNLHLISAGDKNRTSNEREKEIETVGEKGRVRARKTCN